MTQTSISHSLKHQLDSKIHSLATHSKDYTNHPKDFTRTRKLTFETTLKLLLSMGSQSLSNERLSFFNFALETPTASAFTQAQNKIKLDTFKALFYGTRSQEKLLIKALKAFIFMLMVVQILPFLIYQMNQKPIKLQEKRGIILV